MTIRHSSSTRRCRLLFAQASGAVLLAVTLVVVGRGLPAVGADEHCYRDWSDAAPVVAREGLRPASDVQGVARRRFGGDIVRITLCREAGAFVYRLVVRAADGRISNTVVSAGPAAHR